MTRLFILDPLYETVTGHNHAVNSLLLDEASARGIDAVVLANASLPARDRVIPAFPLAYGFMPKDSLQALQHAHLIGTSMVQTLAGSVQPHLTADTIVFAHTLNSPLLHGFAAWLESLPAPGDISVRLGLNLPPDFRQTRPELALWTAYQYVFAFSLLATHAPATRLYAETRELQSQFAGFANRPVDFRRLPLRVVTEHLSRSRAAGDGKLIYFMPGEFRGEKGHVFIMQAILRIAERRPAWLERIRFRFTSVRMPDEVAVILARHSSLFEVIDEKSIPVDRYWQLMAEADVLGCTYNPVNYARRSSGIFSEALAIGKPVVVSAGTSMAAEMVADRHAYGVTVEFGNVDSLASGLERMVESYASFQQGAAAVAERFRQEISGAAFLDWLLRDDGMGRGTATVP